MTPVKTRVTYAVLADGHKVVKRGKVDCYGIFSLLGVWAVPAHRECSIAFGLKDIPKGKTTLSFWFRRTGKKAIRIGAGDIDSPDAHHVTTLARRIHLPVKDLGPHEVGVSVGTSLRGRTALWLPVLIDERPWPELPTGEALQDALGDAQSVKSVRANLKCQKCNKEYVFQVNLDPDVPLPNGAREFPRDGVFKCPKCRSVHQLKDVEGQLRYQLARPIGEDEG